MYAKQSNSKFGFLAVQGSSTALDHAVDLGDGVSAHPSCPIDLSTNWKEWLGTVRAAKFQEANFLIAIEVQSETPKIIDHETVEIEERLGALWKGILLQGVPHYTDSLEIIGGIDSDGAMAIRSVATNARAFQHRYSVALEITPIVVTAAKELADSIVAIYEPGTDFRRLRAGMRALINGLENPYATERLHAFVRALDGLMMIPKGPGDVVFAGRGRTFVTATKLHDLLVKMYRLRNTQEHLNDFKTEIDASEPREYARVLSLRAYQAQEAALASYRRLLKDPALVAHFRTETTITSFWSLGEHDRSALWGPGFDLDAAAAEHERLFSVGVREVGTTNVARALS